MLFRSLASGVKNEEGFWLVGVKNCDENILEDKNLLDCHRKELIGFESAKDILFAINLNINNLFNELRKKLLYFRIVLVGITYSDNIGSNILTNFRYMSVKE